MDEVATAGILDVVTFAGEAVAAGVEATTTDEAGEVATTTAGEDGLGVDETYTTGDTEDKEIGDEGDRDGPVGTIGVTAFAGTAPVSAAKTGQMVVYRAIISVTTELSGQFVTVGGHAVTV